MGAKPATQGGGFAHGKPIPDERRCVAVVVRGKRAGEVCAGWTSLGPDGAYTQFCAAHLGVPQRRWKEMSEERRLERRLALDAKKAEEAAARDKVEKVRQEEEAKKDVQREELRQRQRERELEEIAKREEEQARRHPPEWPKPQRWETWIKKRKESGRGKHDDERGSFDWAIVPISQVVQEEANRALLDGMRQRDKLMSGKPASRRQLIGALNAKRRRDQDVLNRWP